MKNAIIILRMWLVVSAAALALCSATGCGLFAMAEGPFFATCEGRVLHGDDRTPVVGIDVSVGAHPVDAKSESELADRLGKLNRTDADGRYRGTLSYSWWGCPSFLGLIPLGNPFPAPPELEAVFIYIHEDGKWRERRVPLTKDMQRRRFSGKRHIKIPDIILPVEQ